jgi:hypothetical protein
VFGAAAHNNKVVASYCGAFQKMERIIKGSSRVLGHKLRLRNGKFVFLTYLHRGNIAEQVVAESLYLI